MGGGACVCERGGGGGGGRGGVDGCGCVEARIAAGTTQDVMDPGACLNAALSLATIYLCVSLHPAMEASDYQLTNLSLCPECFELYVFAKGWEDEFAKDKDGEEGITGRECVTRVVSVELFEELVVNVSPAFEEDGDEATVVVGQETGVDFGE
ncbi:hypothetical protein WMY93_010572 [Mugilogobius chulae]|uniref:Uncharacterized protein n=1 Tax=Mugilogobius chulae TaxID=88201 RepID=A0AAW0PE15_9GOBI